MPILLWVWWLGWFLFWQRSSLVRPFTFHYHFQRSTDSQKVWQGGQILLQSTPVGVDVEDVKHDLEKVPGVISVHELHVWRLTEEKSFASAHIVIADPSLDHFQAIAKTMNECLHAYGIHSATIQPEIASSGVQIEGTGPEASNVLYRRGVREASGCEIHCGSLCEEKSCCGWVSKHID